MMSDIKKVIKNLDENIFVRLRFEAKKQGLGLNAYVLSLIRESLGIDKIKGNMTDKKNLSLDYLI